MTAFNPMNSILVPPSTDFAAVRDRRNSPVFYVDIALDTARSVAAGTMLILPISGNSFYCDADPSDGNARVHFQDTNFDRAAVPLYVSPGCIFSIPFTQCLFENTAQTGKKIRIAYGLDIDFLPGSVAQIAVTNQGGFSAVRPETPSGFYADISSVVINTPLVVFSAAANPNGAIILGAELGWSSLGTVDAEAFIAKATPPVAINDGDLILGAPTTSIFSATLAIGSGILNIPQFVAAGKGLYHISTATHSASGTGYKFVRYKLL